MNPDLLRRISAEFDRIEEAAACGASIELDDLFSDLPAADRAIALREVQELLEELHHSGHPFSSTTSAASLSARFDPVELTNQGGMGEIWLAIDQDFNRHVAIKEIIPSAAQDEGFRRRFFREADITAKLEHPGILPVYGKGTHADGRPFYAMRWVAGAGAQTLQEAIRELYAADLNATNHEITNHEITNHEITNHEFTDRNAADTVRFQLPDLLQRFVSVCQTIAFAHHAGVIHRDLKPANILLGPFGETFVVDWGLAVDLGEPASLVAPMAATAGSIVGTPGFVAPECLKNPQLADQRSDIYSLGLILYHLCAGSSPFSQSVKVAPEKLQAAILRGEIPPLRTVNPSLHPALEAICHQATAVDPARRYASARDLAADVSRYLSGLPTQAWPESWRYRIRRWIQSHTAAVAALGMTILLSLGGAVGYGWITSRHNVELSDKSIALENALQAESKQKLAAVEWGELAANREELARQAIDTFWHSVAEDPSLRYSAELQDLRRSLLARPMEFYRTLAESHALAANHSPQSLANFVDARLEWSKLQIECDEWSTARSNVEQVLERINDYLEQTADADGQWLYRQALTLTTLMRIHTQLGDHEAAREARENFASLSTQIARLADVPPPLEVILAEQEMVSASTLAMQNQMPRARELVVSARQRAKKLHERFPDNRSYAVLQEELLNDSALIALRSGDLQLAQTQLQELLDQLKSISANEGDPSPAAGSPKPESPKPESPKPESPKPESLEWYNRRILQAAVTFNLAVVAQRQGDVDRTLQLHQQALQQRLQLSQQLPFANELLRTVGHSYQAMADLHFRRNEIESGIEHYRKLVEVNRRLFRQQPIHLPTQMELVATLHQLGHFELSAGHRSAALERFEEASPLAVEIMKTKPAEPLWQRHQVELAVHLGTLHFEDQRWQQALDYFEQAFEGQQQYATQPNSTPQDQGIFRLMLKSMIEIAERFEQKEQAERLQQLLHSFETRT